MSYALSGPLQAAVFDLLNADAALAALVGSAIYDAVPSGTLPEIYVRLGSERVSDASDRSGAGALHHFTVSVITSVPGFSGAKAAAAAICDALLGPVPVLSRGRVVSLGFERAVAKRIDTAASRQIDLQFRARVADD